MLCFSRSETGNILALKKEKERTTPT